MRKTALILAILMTLATLAGCGGSTTANTTTASGGTTAAASGGTTAVGSTQSPAATTRDDVNIYVEAPWDTMDPHNSATYSNDYVINQMYEPMVNVDDTGDVIPCLATEWTISNDGLTYTFKLLEGVKFHNGEVLKASDVAFSYNRAIECPQMFDFTAMIEKVEAVGDNEVKITLKTPFAPFLSYVSYIFIVNEKFTDENAGNLNKVACGTGPYILETIDMNVSAKLTAFADYHLGEARIHTINFKIILDPTTAALAFKSHELDYYTPSSSSFLEYQSAGTCNTASVATLHTTLITLNNEVAPFDNKALRQALNYAADRESMIKVAFDSLAAPALLLASEAAFGVDYSHATEYKYDLDKAKAKLAEAGYPDGLDLGSMYTMPGSYHEKIAQVFQESCRQIGITFEIVGMESTTIVGMMITGDYGISGMGFGFASDFAYNSRHYTTAGIDSSNLARYSNARVDELFALGQSETDPAVRQKYYNEVVEIITEDCPYIPVMHRALLSAWDSALTAVPHVDSSKPYFVYEWSWN